MSTLDTELCPICGVKSEGMAGLVEGECGQAEYHQFSTEERIFQHIWDLCKAQIVEVASDGETKVIDTHDNVYYINLKIRRVGDPFPPDEFYPLFRNIPTISITGTTFS